VTDYRITIIRDATDPRTVLFVRGEPALPAPDRNDPRVCRLSLTQTSGGLFFFAMTFRPCETFEIPIAALGPAGALTASVDDATVNLILSDAEAP